MASITRISVLITCHGSSEQDVVWLEKDLPGLLEQFLYNKVQRATKCKHTSWAGLCHYTLLLCCVFVYVCVLKCVQLCVCVV